MKPAWVVDSLAENRLLNCIFSCPLSPFVVSAVLNLLLPYCNFCFTSAIARLNMLLVIDWLVTRFIELALYDYIYALIANFT